MQLYSYWRSTTSFRVRMALNLKGITCELVPVDLIADDQRAPSYLKLNRGAGVPTLVLDDGTVLTQSMAIIDYLDSTWPEPSLIPDDPMLRTRVLALAHTIALDVHPVNNLRVLRQLKSRFQATQDDVRDWVQHWMVEGFTAAESLIEGNSKFAFGNVGPGLADICLAAQSYNALRWDVDLSAFPKVQRITENTLQLPAVQAAHPDNQPEAKVTP